MDYQSTLYSRLGGYDAIAAVVNDLLPRLMEDPTLARFWANRGADGIAREKQLLIDFLCANSGGPVMYTGRENKLSHRGMGITDQDWSRFQDHLVETLEHFQLPAKEKADVLAFIHTTKNDIVE